MLFREMVTVPFVCAISTTNGPIYRASNLLGSFTRINTSSPTLNFVMFSPCLVDVETVDHGQNDVFEPSLIPIEISFALFDRID